MSKNFSLVLILLSLAITGCDPNPAKPIAVSASGAAQILGGTDISVTDPIAHSAVLLIKAKLLKDNSIDAIESCSGVLLSDQLVLTAAHCLTDQHSSRPMLEEDIIFVYFKNSTTMDGFFQDLQQGYSGNSPVRFARSSQVLAHPKYAGSDSKGNSPETQLNDIGILRLNEVSPSGYTPAAILKDATLLVPGLPVIAVGYGPIPRDEKNDAFILRSVDMKIQNLEPNWKQMHLQNVYNHGLIAGDSGGPVFTLQDGKLKVWGINSQGNPHGMGSSIEIIANSLDFIASAAASLGLAPPF